MSKGQNVLVELRDKVSLVIISRPEKRNALDRETLDELYKILKLIDSNDETRAVVITGAGDKAFVSGADISVMKNRSSFEAAQGSKKGCEVFSFIENMKAPVIAEINGWALGGGCELALACDLRIAGKKARIGQPEIKIGIIPGYAGCFRLPRLIGIGRAKEMIYTGRILEAEEAEKIGLVNKVVDDDKLMEEVMTLAKELAEGPIAISFAKSAVTLSFDVGKEKRDDLTSSFYENVFKTKDCKEGINAFLEKRRPLFDWK